MEHLRRFPLVNSYACPLEKYQFKDSGELISHPQFDHHKLRETQTGKEKNVSYCNTKVVPHMKAEAPVNQDPKVTLNPSAQRDLASGFSPSSQMNSPTPVNPTVISTKIFSRVDPPCMTNIYQVHTSNGSANDSILAHSQR